MYNPFSLSDKKILITGASSGIGRVIALECAKMGGQLIITGRNRERLDDTLTTLEGFNHQSIIADLTNKAELSEIIDNIDPIDGIVHCAGIVKSVPFKFLNENDFSLVMDTNFYAPVFLTRDILRKKKLKRHSSIVLISSIAGVLVANKGNSMYAASKGALTAIGRILAIELSTQGVRVNSILPAMINSELNETNELITQEQLLEDAKKYPLGGYGKPEDVAYGCIYLLSDASKWVTGSLLLIDGGKTTAY